jgi:inosine/xanthosine triphosphate pyrophosphatase family protein
MIRFCKICKEECKKIAPYGAVTEEKQGQKGFPYDKMYKFPEYYAIRADSIVQKIGILLVDIRNPTR